MATQLEALTLMLGGRSKLKTTLRNEDDLIEIIREGLPYESFEAVAGRLEMTIEEAATSVGIVRRTLSRRKQEASRLSQSESERALRLARIGMRAQEVLGSVAKAHHWLSAPNRSLGGKRPIDLLDVDLGAARVEQVLGRIEYGVYS